MHLTKEKAMQIIDIITYISFSLIAIALTALVVLRFWGLRKVMVTPRGSDIKAIIKKALKQLNVNAEWTKSKDTFTTRFAYQGGNFSIEVEKGHAFATINYLYFYKAGMDSIENVRSICNLCNINAENCRIVYTVDTKENCADLHFISEIHIVQNNAEQALQAAMGDAFRWQSTFIKKFESLGGKKKSDQEKKLADIDSELELMREQEMMQQPEGPEWHETTDKPFSLGHVLATTMGFADIVPICLTITQEDGTRTISTPEDILGMCVNNALIYEGKFLYESAFAKLDFYDPRNLSRERHMMIDFEAEGQTKDTLYYRVTLSVSPASPNGQPNDGSWQRQKLMTSVLLGHDLTPSEERQTRFKYVWKEAMNKAKNGDEASMTEEERMLADMQNPHTAKNFHIGKRLYLQKRFYEALGHLTDAYRELENRWSNKDCTCKDSLDETAYLIACCYLGLGQYDRACFYIQATMPRDIDKFTEVYINCLVNNRDFRALHFIDNLLSTLSRSNENNFTDSYEDEDDDQYNSSDQQIEEFIGFLKRRKAFTLVNLGRYDEAQAMLTKMLNEPENSDFALNELAYIQKNK